MLKVISKINYLVSNVKPDDSIEYLNPLTDVIIYLFETIPIEELQKLAIVNNVLDKFVNNCEHQNLCSKALAGMSINFFESVHDRTEFSNKDLTPELLEKYNSDNEYLVYVYGSFSEKLLILLNQEEELNRTYRKDVTYALLNITYYANKKLKVLTEQFSENEQLLKTKMVLINKIAVIFLDDEITNKTKQDAFMVNYFYNIILVTCFLTYIFRYTI